MISGSNFLNRLKDCNLTYAEFIKLDNTQRLPYFCARIRRTLKRFVTEKNQRSVLHSIYARALTVPNYKIQRTDFILLPEHVDKTFLVYTGKIYQKLKVQSTMVGKYIGAFILCKQYVNHNKEKQSKQKHK